MTAPLPVLCYWEGSRSPLLDLCLETVERHHPGLRLLGPGEVRQMGGSEALDLSEGMLRPHRSDLVRFWVLKTIGGLWFDCDCVVLQPSPLGHDVASGKAEAAVFQGFSNPLVAGFHFAAKPGRVLDFAYAKCKAALTGDSCFYNEPSSGVLAQVVHRFPAAVSVTQDQRYLPIPFLLSPVQFLSHTRAAKVQKRLHRRLPYMFHLGGYVANAFGHLSREQLLAGPWLVSYCLRVALGMEHW